MGTEPPSIGLGHLIRLTDDFGIWQHTVGKDIDRSNGYSLDDAARALLVALAYDRLDLAAVYLGFIERACTSERIINFFHADRAPWDRPWSPDALGETYWALATAIDRGFEPETALRIIDQAITPRLYEMRQELRPAAYLLLGATLIDAPLAEQLTEQLLAAYRGAATPDWPWPEDGLYYANAILPYALLAAGSHEATQTGLTMLAFLNRSCRREETVTPIGNKGWYKRDGVPSRDGQQPIDAAYQVLANVAAHKSQPGKGWLAEARDYLNWFWGQNSENTPLIDLSDESCRDGIDEQEGVSENRGSEGIVCYLLAQKELLENV